MTRPARITLRTAAPSEAKKLLALITAQLEEGRLLPRTLEELTCHAGRFVVAIKGRKIIGCGELAPLSGHVAEVRSLAVDGSVRHRAVGTMIVEELRQRARRAGFEKFCAFTHAPGFFIQMGFSIVPHMWLTEKIVTDCLKCPLFQRCAQYAMVIPLDDASEPAHSDTRPTGYALRLA